MKQYTFKDGFKCVASTIDEAKEQHKAFAAGNETPIEKHIVSDLKFKKQKSKYSGITFVKELGNVGFDGHAGYNGENIPVFLELWSEDEAEYLKETDREHFISVQLKYKKSEWNKKEITIINKSLWVAVGNYAELDYTIKNCIDVASKLMSV